MTGMLLGRAIWLQACKDLHKVIAGFSEWAEGGCSRLCRRGVGALLEDVGPDLARIDGVGRGRGGGWMELMEGWRLSSRSRPGPRAVTDTDHRVVRRSD
jgi:hypothetical protein